MTIENINALAEEVYQNAVEHGFYTGDDSREVLIAMLHCELSEALQQDRAGMPMIWYRCKEAESYQLPEEKPHICAPADETECLNFGKEAACKYRSTKPEGIAVELADFAILLLGFVVHSGFTLSPMFVPGKEKESIVSMSVPKLVNHLHDGICPLHSQKPITPHQICIHFMLAIVNAWLESKGYDLWEIVRLKVEYNKTRPPLHDKLY